MWRTVPSPKRAVDVPRQRRAVRLAAAAFDHGLVGAQGTLVVAVVDAAARGGASIADAQLAEGLGSELLLVQGVRDHPYPFIKGGTGPQ